jgi:hypothetical protein
MTITVATIAGTVTATGISASASMIFAPAKETGKPPPHSSCRACVPERGWGMERKKR